MDRQNIKALDHDQLVQELANLNQPKFRAAQIEQWLWSKHARSFDEMTNLPKSLREVLAQKFSLPFPVVLARQISQDGTRKYLVGFEDGIAVETVGIPSKDGTRLTVCFSTQAGCAMGCVFCATGRGGFARNLASHEMYDQIVVVSQDFGERVTNVVAMGQGEPFANYDAVLAALRLMNNESYLNIGARHITVSTCGIIKGIERFAKEPEQFTLAVSLHAAIQQTRDELMPGTRPYPLKHLRSSLISYSEITRRRPTFEYALIEEVNDTDAHLAALVNFAQGMLCHINLIALNPIDKDDDPSRMKPSSKIHLFEREISKHGIEVSIRDSRGADIDGACGQLRQNMK